MKIREFNKLCRIHFGKRKKNEINLTEDQKHNMLLFLVRKQWPVHVDFITDKLDWAWIHSCAYFHRGKHFLYTSEQECMYRSPYGNFDGVCIKEW